jgi:L-threonylcarbamoyladenylate synthase
MKTVVTDSPYEAAQFIRKGRIAAFPTETVYGLGANVFDTRAIESIFKAKRRPSDNPLIVHIAEKHQVGSLTTLVTSSAQILIDRFFPGPLTVVLEKSKDVPATVTAGLETIGIRMPQNPTAHAFLLACATPVAAPSANLSGRPSPTTWQAVLEDLDGRIDCILKGDPATIGLESTVVDCSREVPVLLRPGAISIDELRSVLPQIVATSGGSEDARSPGMRHQHYSPAANVQIIVDDQMVDDAETCAFIGVHDRLEQFALKLICADTQEYARRVFEFFRECDRRGINRIVCEAVPHLGLGGALMDRLRRASQKRPG